MHENTLKHEFKFRDFDTNNQCCLGINCLKPLINGGVSSCLSLPTKEKVFILTNYKEHHLNEVIIT